MASEDDRTKRGRPPQRAAGWRPDPAEAERLARSRGIGRVVDRAMKAIEYAEAWRRPA